jgi:hypothetical protein
VRVFRVYNGALIVGHVSVPAVSRDALAAAEHEANTKFGLWDRLHEINYIEGES